MLALARETFIAVIGLTVFVEAAHRCGTVQEFHLLPALIVKTYILALLKGATYSSNYFIYTAIGCVF